MEKENQKANIKNYLTDYYLVEKENQQLKIENETLKEKISTQLQNNADNVDFMENQRKEIERLKEKLKDIKNNYRRQIDSLLIARLNLFKQLKQSQNKKAIEELEKVKKYFLTTDDWLVDGCELLDFVNNLIKEL